MKPTGWFDTPSLGAALELATGMRALGKPPSLASVPSARGRNQPPTRLGAVFPHCPPTPQGSSVFSGFFFQIFYFPDFIFLFDSLEGRPSSRAERRKENHAEPPTQVTRDTYPEGASFSAPFIAAAACGVAAAAAHLHSRGISHGDLYAHNILVRQ